jgi:hypothetical protein
MDKSALTAKRLKTEKIHLDGLEEPITVRGLSRAEMHVGSQIGERKGAAEQEQFLLSCALVDPAMSPEDVRAWQEGSPFGEINEVQKAVNRLSGIGKDATKSDVPGDGARPVD